VAASSIWCWLVSEPYRRALFLCGLFLEEREEGLERGGSVSDYGRSRFFGGDNKTSSHGGGRPTMHAFLSYQTDERAIAARVSDLLSKFGITSFMAHEHIEVSVEWRIEILRQLGFADLFVPILSAKYYSSIWCKQESGIAALGRLSQTSR
jgi:TIR domain